MALKISTVALGVGFALLAGGCSSGGGFLGLGDQASSPVTTGSLPEPKVDPACQGLSAQITSLRQEGTVTFKVSPAPATVNPSAERIRLLSAAGTSRPVRRLVSASGKSIVRF